ncbi:carcinoembryonic antigen-related cell adhesion molecule 16-like [Dendropsophus ebraccatus]|uniref:carcinoembryonic antigen-related cell adhesion molecule 16-like n=1 Tax=Dendropsophus ebraccatus TaxID=150705 RepID=UPI003831A52E
MSGSHSTVLRSFVLSVLLHACIGATNKLNIEVLPVKPKSGETLTLKVSGVNGNILFASWYKGLSTSATDQILTHLNGKDIKGPQFFKEASCNPNGSLVIQNFQETFKGDYTVQIQTNLVLQDGHVAVDGVASAVFSPFTVLLGLLLSVTFL